MFDSEGVGFSVVGMYCVLVVVESEVCLGVEL